MQDESKFKRIALETTFPNHDLKQIFFFVGFLGVLLLDLVLNPLKLNLRKIIPKSLTFGVGIPIFLFALVMARISLQKIYVNKLLTKSLSIDGPFKYSRHPMYFSAILIYGSLIIISLSIIAAFYFLGVAFYYYRAAIFEESVLIQVFGQEYEDYKRNTSRWIGCKKKNSNIYLKNG